MDWKKRAKELQNAMDARLGLAKTENRAFTAEEKAAHDKDSTEFDNCIAMIDAEKAVAARADQLREPVNPPVNSGDVVVKSNPPLWNDLAEAMVAVKRAASGQGIDDRLVNAATGHSVGVPADGGFDVGTDAIAGIDEKIKTVAVLKNRVKVQPIGANANGIKWTELAESSRATGSRAGGIQGYWLAEADTLTASKAKTAKRQMDLEKVGVLFYATEELLQDSAAMSAMATRLAGEEIAWLVDDAIYCGVGAGKPLGVTQSPALVTVAKETNQVAATIVEANVRKMYSRMTPSSMANAAWYINPDVLPELQEMGIATAKGTIPVYMPANGYSEAPYGTLFGRPVVPIEQAHALGTLGDIVFADMSEYMLIEKGGIKSASSIHVQFLTDQQVFRFIYRVNGMPTWANSITSAKGSTARSPYVALATRS